LYGKNILQQIEFRKRKREIVYSILIGLFFILFTWGQIKLYGISHTLPFHHSIFFFGLVNLNIVLLLFLSFLIFRNVTKIFVERKGKLFGSSLKSKLIAAFLAFSFVPTFLLFLVSVFYINSSFDKWFNVKIAGILKDSIEIPNYFYVLSKKKNYHFAEEILREIRGPHTISKDLQRLREKYSLDAIEYYPDLFEERTYVLSEESSLTNLPKLSLEFLEKALRDHSEASTIHQAGQGNLVRAVIPVPATSSLKRGALVVSSFIPLSITSKMDDIAVAYEEFRDLDPLEYPIKSIYLIILVLITLVILMAASWFGFHLAKELSVPLMKLGNASKKITKGVYEPVDIKTGSAEIEYLIENFNFMTEELFRSEKTIKQANKNLKEALDVLDEHSKYIEVVISNISTGVISFDLEGKIKTINQKAKNLLHLESNQLLNHHFKQVLPADFVDPITELMEELSKTRKRIVKKEVQLTSQEDSLLLQMTMTPLRDDQKETIGLVLVFDDLTILVNAQRAAAWREVAKRIAHEIKNPLTPIQLSAQRLNKKFGDQISDPAFGDCIHTIIQQVDSLKNMVNEFSNFARLPQAKPIEGSLHQVLNEVTVLYSTAHKDVKFSLDLDVDLPNFYFDPEQIKRVVVNLVENSIFSLQKANVKEVKLQTKYDKALNLVTLEIIDSGEGVDESNLQRLFEPYYTTKEEGTGLGLAIVKRIIQDHNGFIRAFNESDGGLRMLIELPVATKLHIPLEG
jgi:two-component system, NtrC family, nitrogen regulation sensor histidine kinase NtrY